MKFDFKNNIHIQTLEDDSEFVCGIVLIAFSIQFDTGMNTNEVFAKVLGLKNGGSTITAFRFNKKGNDWVDYIRKYKDNKEALEYAENIKKEIG